MSAPNDQHKHVDAILEPIAARAQTRFVEVTSEPIPFCSPLARIGGFFASMLAVLRWFFSSQWKVGLAVCFSLIACELLVGSLEPRLKGRIYSKAQTAGHVIGMNSQGFRGETLAPIKPVQSTRILALGDSVTFGTGVAIESTWPAQLQQQLDSPQRRVEVLNAGLGGLDLQQIQLELGERWAQHEPDYAVLMVTGNLVSLSYARRNRSEILPPNAWKREPISLKEGSGLVGKMTAFYQSCALPGALTIGMDHLKFALGLENHAVDPANPLGIMLAHGYQQNDIDEKIIDEAWARFANHLASLVAATTQLDIPLVVIYAPPRFALSESRTDNWKWVNKERLRVDPFQRIAAICQGLDVPFLDPREPLSQAPKPVYVLSDYTHFDESGHKVIAAEVAEHFRTRVSD